MLFRESVTTAIYVKCHSLARHVNERDSPPGILCTQCVRQSVTQVGEERLNDGGSHQCVCVTASLGEGGQEKEKKINKSTAPLGPFTTAK